jgi:DNA-binding XRE family transcriptional regulator
MPKETPCPETHRHTAASTSAPVMHPREFNAVQREHNTPGAADSSAPTMSPSPELPLFQNRAVTPIATGGPMLSSAQALIRRDLWTNNEDGKPVYRRRFSQGRVIEHYITTADPTSQYPEALAGEAAWQIVEQFGIPTAYLHLVFAAHAASQPSPWQGLFRLQGSDLIKTLGMEKRTDVAKPEKLKELAKQAELLGSVGVWVVWREGKRDLNVRASRMWDVALDVHSQQGSGDAGAVPSEITLTVRPGLWTEKFLNRAGRDAGLALRQFGYLAQATLRINPYHEELAAKLAVYLTIMSRLRATYRVQNLLAAVEPETSLQQATMQRQKRYKFKRRWDDALLTLHEHGWQIHFDPTTYPVALRPDWALPETMPPHLRQLPVGYFRLLLAATLTLTPPDPIPSLLGAGFELASRPAPSMPASPLLGSQIRQAREAKGWSQQHLAMLVGKSQQWIAFIERGQRKIQPQDQIALRTLLGFDSTQR